MKRRPRSIIARISPSLAVIVLLLALWQLLSVCQAVPSYMLPSPLDVCRAFVEDFSLLAYHSVWTLQEAVLGLLAGILCGFACAVLMDAIPLFRKAVYPLIVVTQTVPTVAIAPLLVLWFGYGILPKVILIVLATFFPLSVGLLEGFQNADPDTVNLMRAMGAGKIAIFRHVKLPSALPEFFSGLRIAMAYAIVGAVISEWLGGFYGLGVYMTRVKKAFAFDKMFAVIFLVSALSLLAMQSIGLLERLLMPYRRSRTQTEKGE